MYIDLLVCNGAIWQCGMVFDRAHVLPTDQLKGFAGFGAFGHGCAFYTAKFLVD